MKKIITRGAAVVALTLVTLTACGATVATEDEPTAEEWRSSWAEENDAQVQEYLRGGDTSTPHLVAQKVDLPSGGSVVCVYMTSVGGYHETAPAIDCLDSTVFQR